MSPTLIIARREYKQIATTRAFQITLVVMPLFIAAIIGLVTFLRPPTGEAYAILDRGGHYGAAVERRLELDYQRGAMNRLATYAEGKNAPSDQPWAKGRRWFSDAEVQAFIAAGGAQAAQPALARIAAPGAAPFKAPERQFLQVAPPKELVDTGALKTFPKSVATKVGKRPLTLVLDIPADFGPGKPARVLSDGRPNSYLLGLMQGELTRALRNEAMQKSGIDPGEVAALERINAPLALTATKRSNREGLALNSIIPGVMGYLLMITVMITGMMLLQSVIEERSNKLIESILACVRPQDLMQGKLLGICSVGLTVIAVWGLFAAAAVNLAPPEARDVVHTALASIKSPMLLVLAPFYYLTGYLAFAMLFLAVGAISESMQDAQAYMTPLWIILMVPYIVLPTSVAMNPSGTIAVVLSWIPIYTPFAMLYRLGTGVSMIEILATSVILLAFLAVEWVLIGKLFRQSLLRTGQPKLGEMIKLMFARPAG